MDSPLPSAEDVRGIHSVRAVDGVGYHWQRSCYWDGGEGSKEGGAKGKGGIRGEKRKTRSSPESSTSGSYSRLKSRVDLSQVPYSSTPELRPASLSVAEHTFTFVFTVELALRIIAASWVWLISFYNFLDFLLVGGGQGPTWEGRHSEQRHKRKGQRRTPGCIL